MGKSTAVQRAVDTLGVKVGGFRSAFGPDRGEADRWLYLWDAGEVPVYEDARGVVRFTQRRPEVFPARFDALGGGALRRARETGAELILMDECGRFEECALGFQREIFAALEGDTPVLGVIRQGYHGWLDRLREHPKVRLMVVTPENRDALPEQIAAQIQRRETPL